MTQVKIYVGSYLIAKTQMSCEEIRKATNAGFTIKEVEN